MKDIQIKEYQEEGAGHISAKKAGILAFPTGQGKCVTSIRAFELSDLCQMIVVAPTNALTSWLGDIKRFWEGSAIFYDTKDKDLSAFFLKAKTTHPFTLVVPQSRLHQMVERYSVDLQHTKFMLVVDEIDDVTNFKTTLFRHLMYMSKVSTRVYGLSGSPIHAKLEKTYAYLNIVFPRAHPYGPWSQFAETYLLQRERRSRHHAFMEVVGYRNVDLFREIFESICVRVVSNVKVDFEFVDVTLHPKEMFDYVNAAYDAFMSNSPAAHLHALQQIVDGIGMPDRVQSTKPLRLWKLLREELAPRGNPVIVYVEYHETRITLADLLSRVKIPFMQIIGGMDAEDRQEVLDWAAEGGFKVILMTRAGIRGANLQVCESTVCFDTPFDIKNLIQLLGRQARIGSPYEKNYVYFILAADTIDEYKVANVRQSSSLILEVLRGSATLPESTETLTRDDVIKMRQTVLWRKKQQNHLS